MIESLTTKPAERKKALRIRGYHELEGLSDASVQLGCKCLKLQAGQL